MLKLQRTSQKLCFKIQVFWFAFVDKIPKKGILIMDLGCFLIEVYPNCSGEITNRRWVLGSFFAPRNPQIFKHKHSNRK